MIVRIVIFLLVFRTYTILCDNVTASEVKQVLKCETNETTTNDDFFCTSKEPSSCSEICKDETFCCEPGLCCELKESENKWEKIGNNIGNVLNNYAYPIGGFVVFLFFILSYYMKSAKKKKNSPMPTYQNPPPVPPTSNPYGNSPYDNNFPPMPPYNNNEPVPAVPPPQFYETPGNYPRQNVNQITSW